MSKEDERTLKNLQFERQVSPKHVHEKLDLALEVARPWKATGIDGIPAGIYKLLTSANKYLKEYIIKTYYRFVLTQLKSIKYICRRKVEKSVIWPNP